jgi:putative ABC transport system ATP-binding protein
MNMAFCVEARNLSKVYGEGAGRIEALKDVSFNVPDGQFVSIMGPSGCGKSTLLHLLGGMETPTSGEVRLMGESLASMGDDPLTLLRRTSIGFLFQFFNLLPTLSVLENVEVPLLLAGTRRAEASLKAAGMLQKVGLGAAGGRDPQELSAGEQQRVALARALVHQPKLVLADEPTGNLDSSAGAAVLKLLRELSARQNQTVLLATHNREAADSGDTVILLRDGQVTGIYPVGRGTGL